MKTEDDFFRGEHPDTRTNEEFLRDIENKMFVKSVESKSKRQYISSRVMCVQTGQVFIDCADAEVRLNLCKGVVSRHLNGEKKRIAWKYTFIRVN